ncbi:MAG: hypothetical protein JO301_09700 [Chitinophagaceae bacterium]|nr:hypothetical protein [Chitinophagaceae bacterium]
MAGLTVLLTVCGRLSAQQPLADTASTAYAVRLYQQFLYPEKALYTGRQYLDYRNVLYENHHPFFRSPDFQPGSVYYDGVLYEDISLQYDIVKNVIVTWDPYRKYLIELLSAKLDWFTINDTRFVHIRPEAGMRSPVEDGFYRLLYDGKITVLKKEAKRVVQEIDIKRVQRLTEETPSYYIRKGNAYFPVSNKSSVLKVLNDQKAELNQFIRKQNLDFSGEKEKALAAIAAQYDQLTR